MNYLLLPALALAFLSSCMTTGELERLQFSVQELGNTVNARDSTFAEIGAAVDQLATDIEEVQEDVEERTKNFISAGEAGVGGTGLVGLGLLALNQFRNGRRRQRKEPV